MKKLTSAESIITINHYKNLLQSEGIPTRVRNDLDYDRAKQLIESVEDESPTMPWTCRKCGERNEGQFAACWNCGEAVDN